MSKHDYDTGSQKGAIRYSTVAVILHWMLAALIFYNLASGLLRHRLPHDVFQFHVSAGISILALSIARVIWRLTHRPPAFLELNPWERRLARLVHGLLYVAMLIVPFSGWAMVSAKPPMGSAGAAWSLANQPAASLPANAATPPKRLRGPTTFLGLFKLPLLSPITELGREPEGVARQRALRDRIQDFHLFGAWMMFGLLLLHIAGALKHQFVDRRRQLARMGLGKLAPAV
ncbi:MAG: cytochrome b [Sphingomonas sp.]|jgi:cytochrome b561|uniref:cytochrome b n=1 Tax=Sphingomonas sp. TaxID=28214 RepID=UPI0035629A45